MEVYIVLTRTGTILSKLVKLIKHHKYTHVSISLDRKLDEMYSFGRINPYNPFVGGMVHEHINMGTFKRFKNTKCIVLKWHITEKEYQKLVFEINNIFINRSQYSFNILGLLWVIVNRRRIRKNKFYCAEFVKYVIDKAGIRHQLPFVITPNDFLSLENTEVVYEGYLQKYIY